VADYLGQLQAIALDVARAKGARVFVKLNAWPDEIELIDAATMETGTSTPGLLQGQIIVRDKGGAVITRLGPEVTHSWVMTGAIVAGVTLLLLVLIRGILPHRKG
jgi:hypothetical protein